MAWQARGILSDSNTHRHGKLCPWWDSTFLICSEMATFCESDLKTLFKVSIELYHSACGVCGDQ